MNIYGKPFTLEEENELYGPRMTEIGKAFKSDDGKHYLLQREDDVLHIFNGNLINTLHVGFFNMEHHYSIIDIEIEEFYEMMRKAINVLQIEKYWKR